MPGDGLEPASRKLASPTVLVQGECQESRYEPPQLEAELHDTLLDAALEQRELVRAPGQEGDVEQLVPGERTGVEALAQRLEGIGVVVAVLVAQRIDRVPQRPRRARFAAACSERRRAPAGCRVAAVSRRRREVMIRTGPEVDREADGEGEGRPDDECDAHAYPPPPVPLVIACAPRASKASTGPEVARDDRVRARWQRGRVRHRVRVACRPMAERRPRRYGDAQLYGRLIQEARPYWPHLLAVFFASLLAAPLALMLPIPIKVVVDSVLDGKPLPGLVAAVLPDGIEADPDKLLWTCTIAVVVLAFLVQLQQFLTWVYQTWVGQKLILGLRARLFDHLQRLSLSFHTKEGTADSLYRLQFDAPSIETVTISGLIPLTTAFIKVVVLLLVTAQIDGSIALIALVGGPVLGGLTQVYRGYLRRRWSEARSRESSAMEVVQETLGSIRVVKAFGQEDLESGRWRERAEAGVDASIKAVRAHGTFDLLVGIATGLGAAAILYVGARHVQEGLITLGELLLALAYLSQLWMPLRELGTRLADLQKALASAARVFALLDEQTGVVEREGARPLERATGAFAFRDVTFGYEPDQPILEDVSLDIDAGAKVGVAGKTGSGKSTLLRLLPRFYDPQAGAITLDGVDLRDIRLADLRRQYAMVLQENVLFSTTIRENIAYGRPGASAAEIEQAAEDASAHEFIAELPDGYETQVGRAACGSRGASASASVSRAPSSATRRCSSSTSRRVHWTRGPRRR